MPASLHASSLTFATTPLPYISLLFCPPPFDLSHMHACFLLCVCISLIIIMAIIPFQTSSSHSCPDLRPEWMEGDWFGSWEKQQHLLRKRQLWPVACAGSIPVPVPAHLSPLHVCMPVGNSCAFYQSFGSSSRHVSFVRYSSCLAYQNRRGGDAGVALFGVCIMVYSVNDTIQLNDFGALFASRRFSCDAAHFPAHMFPQICKPDDSVTVRRGVGSVARTLAAAFCIDLRRAAFHPGGDGGAYVGGGVCDGVTDRRREQATPVFFSTYWAWWRGVSKKDRRDAVRLQLLADLILALIT